MRFLIASLAAIWMLVAAANGGAGDPDRISDITMTQDQMAERADAAWAMLHAADMTAEDHEACYSPDVPEKVYVQCMHRRELTRLFYLLKRGCLGVRAASC
jgi:hypothetical protein